MFSVAQRGPRASAAAFHRKGRARNTRCRHTASRLTLPARPKVFPAEYGFGVSPSSAASRNQTARRSESVGLSAAGVAGATRGRRAAGWPCPLRNSRNSSLQPWPLRKLWKRQ